MFKKDILILLYDNEFNHYVLRVSVTLNSCFRVFDLKIFNIPHTLVIARKSKIFVAIQKIRVWLWITSSSATPRNDSKIFMYSRIRHDTYTCHCEKIEDFRGNPKIHV